jgi:hypothetical protein
MTRSRTVACLPDTFLLGRRDIENLDIVHLLFPAERTDIGACIGLSRHNAGKDQRARPKPLHDAILVPSSGNPCDATPYQRLAPAAFRSACGAGPRRAHRSAIKIHRRQWSRSFATSANSNRRRSVAQEREGIHTCDDHNTHRRAQ